MIAIDNLTGIEKSKRNEIIKCLESLILFKDYQEDLTPVITGYNLYDKLSKSDRIITFSHIHSLEEYKNNMIKDLEGLVTLKKRF